MKTLHFILVQAALFVLLAGMAAAVPVIEEGFFLDGVTGVVRKVDNVDVWKFIPETEVVGLKHTWPAGQPDQPAAVFGPGTDDRAGRR